MNELIEIKTDEQGRHLVSARELHKKLILEQDKNERFSQWFDRHLQYGFIENMDFTSVKIFTVVNNGAQRELQDYAMTIDMAKELCMLQKSEIGKRFREYFIQCEQQLIKVSQKALLLEQIYNGGQEGILASKKLTELETKPLVEKIARDKPLVDFADHVSQSTNSIDIGTFSKLLYDENIHIGRNRLFDWLKQNKYLMKDRKPYQQYVDAGYFEVIEQTFNTPYGEKRVGTKTLVTGKGQIYFTEKLRSLNFK